MYSLIDVVDESFVPDRPKRTSKAPKHPGMLDHSALSDIDFLEMSSSRPSVQEDVTPQKKVRHTKSKSTPKGSADDSAEISETGMSLRNFEVLSVNSGFQNS